MARLWASDAESGVAATEGVTLNGTALPTFSNEQAYNGVLSYKLAPAAQTSWVQRQQATVIGRRYYVRWRFWAPALPGGVTEFLRGIDTGGSIAFRVRTTATGNVQMLSGNASFLGLAGVMNVGAWNLLELEWQINDAAAADECELRLNGASTGVLTPALTDLAIASLRFGQQASSTWTLYYDDIALNDDQGAVENSWPTSIKAAQATSSVSGRGAIVATALKGARAVASVMGRGAVTAAGAKNARAASSVSGAGSVTATGNGAVAPARTGLGRVTGGGSVTAAGRKGARATSTVSAISHVTAAGRKDARVVSIVSAGGRLTVAGSSATFRTRPGHVADLAAGHIVTVPAGHVVPWS